MENLYSTGTEEWFGDWYKCPFCGKHFADTGVLYCPYCGGNIKANYKLITEEEILTNKGL